MNSKLIQLLDTLQKLNSPITAKKLSLALNVSTRTIKSYVSTINLKHRDMIISTKNGYEPDIRKIKSFLATESQNFRMNSAERVNWIIKSLLQNTEKNRTILDIGYFSELLFISEESIRKDLLDVRKKLNVFDLHLVMEKQAYRITGDEINKRKLFSSLLNEEFSTHLFNLSAVKQFFPQYDIDILLSIIIDECKFFGYSINEYALLSLLIDILVSIDRIKLGKQIETITHDNFLFGEREKTLADNIINKIENAFIIFFNESETIEFHAILVNCLLRIDYKNIDLETVTQKVGKECTALVAVLLKEVKNYEFIDGDNPDFIIKFTLHIKQLLNRISSNTFTKNPITQNIKFSCPLIFECAIDIASKINELYDLTISEDEVGYIALHLGSMLIEQTNHKIRCILISPTYHNTAEKMLTRLSELFSETMVISGFFSSIEMIEEKSNLECDFIISTLPIKNRVSTDVIVVNPFLHDRDISQIQYKIERILLERKKEKLINSLLNLSHHKLFFNNLDTNDKIEEKEAAITFLVNQMVSLNYVKATFKSEVFEREQNYSTRFGNIAVPHSMKMDANKTSLSILISKKPINWDDGTVNLVLLFAIAKKDRTIFYDVFDNLLVLLLEEQNLLHILSSNSYEDFIQRIRHIL